MDANKLKKLREIDYVIQPTCETCVHGDFGDRYKAFGTCKVQTYDHLKHTDSERQLSVHAHGHCPKYEPKRESGMLATLGAWTEFAEVGLTRTTHNPESQLDACEVCGGRRGGVPGNENICDGVVMCDYCASAWIDENQEPSL